MSEPDAADRVFETSQILDRPRCDVFAFFAEPDNLESITPPWLGFRIVERDPGPVRGGSRFTYTIRLHGIPLRWRTLIAEWEPERRFMDVQVQGPYAKWHHLHVFDALAADRTDVLDTVVYRLPFGRIGRLVAGRYVRADVERIFAYRRKRIAELLARPPG